MENGDSNDISQSAFTCLKLTVETLEQGVKYVQSNNKDTRWSLSGKQVSKSSLFTVGFYNSFGVFIVL